MKKNLLWGLSVVVCLVVAGAVFFVLNMSSGKESFEPVQMADWLENPDNNVFEVEDKAFYVQEAIGSQQIVLNYPKELRGDFDLSFGMMSLTKQATMAFVFKKANDFYEVQMEVSDTASTLSFFKNKTLLLEKEIAPIEADVFYDFAFLREGTLFLFKLNNTELLKLEMDDKPVHLRLVIVGEPNNPAAVSFSKS